MDKKWSTHTKTPFKVERYDDRIIVADEGRWPVAYIDTDFTPRREADANAKFIVTACNAHKDMLKALEWAAMSEHHPECRKENRGKPYPKCTCHVGAAKAAIAKAKGE